MNDRELALMWAAIREHTGNEDGSGSPVGEVATVACTAVLEDLRSRTQTVIRSLVRERELLGYQLAHAKGLISEEDFRNILKARFVPPTEDPELLSKVEWLAEVLPELDVDLVSAIFRCPVQQAAGVMRVVKDTLALSPKDQGTALSEVTKEYSTKTLQERLLELENERKDVLEALGYYPAHLKRFSLPRLAKIRYRQLCRANKRKYERGSIADEIVKALRLPDYDGAKVKPYFDRLHRENSQMRDELNTLMARDASKTRTELRNRFFLLVSQYTRLVSAAQAVVRATPSSVEVDALAACLSSS